MTKPTPIAIRLPPYTRTRQISHTSRLFHTTTARSNAQPPAPQSQSQPPHQPPKPPHTQPSHPRRQIGRFSLPVFLFFAFTFAAITTSMDTSPSPTHRKHQGASTSLSTLNTNELDASPTSPFVDDNGNPLAPNNPTNLPDSHNYDYDDAEAGSKGIRDTEKERQHDTFNRYGRQRRVPWTLKEVAEAERWQRESRGAALKGEREGRGGVWWEWGFIT